MLPIEYPTIYQICIEGHLDEHWLRWFEEPTISQQTNGQTVISGAIDQAALHGTLMRIRDLSLVLISIQQINSTDDFDENGKSK